jgi:hypothetical protein
VFCGIAARSLCVLCPLKDVSDRLRLATSAVASAGPTPVIASSRLLVAQSMPGDDAAVELQYLNLQCPQLTAESSKTRQCHFREPAIGCVGNDFQQVLDTPAPDGGQRSRTRLDRPGLS